MPRSRDAEIAELIYELRQAWFGHVEPKLSPWTRGFVGFMGSVIILAIMTYLTSGSGAPEAAQAIWMAVPKQILFILIALPILLAIFISKSDRPAGYLRTFLTGSAVTTLIFTMSTLPISIMYGLAG